MVVKKGPPPARRARCPPTGYLDTTGNSARVDLKSMGTRHSFVLLDINLSQELADFFPYGDAALTTQFTLKPRADDLDVIALASERHSILVTADQGFIKKCRIWQEQHRDCLYGLLLLPQGIELQRRILEGIKQGRRKLLHSQYEKSATWLDVHDDNLLIQAHREGFPQVRELCKCPWINAKN